MDGAANAEGIWNDVRGGLLGAHVELGVILNGLLPI